MIRINNDSNLMEINLLTKYGIIHAIDQVLVPPTIKQELLINDNIMLITTENPTIPPSATSPIGIGKTPPSKTPPPKAPPTTPPPPPLTTATNQSTLLPTPFPIFDPSDSPSSIMTETPVLNIKTTEPT